MTRFKIHHVPLPTLVTSASCVALIGVVLVIYPLGLDRLSYDMPFRFEENPPAELVMVYVNDAAKVNLGEDPGDILPRQYYTRLLEKARSDGATMVVFDILTDTPDEIEGVDRAFANAIRAHGNVVLVGEEIQSITGNVMRRQVIPPLDQFADAASGWGLALLATDPDYAVRLMHSGDDARPSLAWVAATILDAEITRDPANRMGRRWLNYYGPPGTISAVNIDHALDGLPPGFFADKIIVVGSQTSVDVAGDERDAFANPWSRFGNGFNAGADVHATTILNLLHNEWLERPSPWSEITVVFLWGAVLCVGLMSLAPSHASWIAVGMSGLLAGVSFYLQSYQHLWWCWVVPAGVQSSIALVWAVGYRYFVEARKRRKLRQAFANYLSPIMADQIADSEFDLSPGGTEVLTTVLFTDLEGFTSMSETLEPKVVAQILTTYFSRMTEHILNEDGTIIKYIGDAIMAVWGAPVADANHARRAVQAACGMIAAGRDEVDGRLLRTRIGINTGKVLAGNLGSAFRFDYTLIGNTVNFAARLEGLNKYLGSDILISDSTRDQIGEEFTIRSLGRFRVVGKQEAVGIHEVLGLAAGFSTEMPWIETFQKGLDCFRQGDFPRAKSFFQATIEQRGTTDGPSQFYLNHLETNCLLHPLPPDWDGVVNIDSK